MQVLRYTLQVNGEQGEHLREILRKAAGVMRQVWGIGKRRFKKGWSRRINCLSFFRFLLHRAVLSIGDLSPVERKNPGAAVVLGPAFLS